MKRSPKPSGPASSDLDPVRLRDDPATSSPLRAGLRRAAHASVAYDVAAGALRFEAAIQPGAPGADPTGPAAEALGAAKPLLGPLAKGLLWSLGGVGLAGTIALSMRNAPAPAPHTPEPAAPTATASGENAQWETREAPPERKDAAPERSSSVPPVRPPDAPVTHSASPRPIASAPASASVSAPASASVSAPAPASVPASASAPDPRSALALEMEHLSRARALLAGDPAAALAAADEGQRRFAAGLFTQERESIAIEALARIGRRAEARARAEAFLASYPRSHFAERIRRNTGLGDSH